MKNLFATFFVLLLLFFPIFHPNDITAIKNVDKTDILLKKAKQYLDKGNYKAAITIYDKVLKIDPYNNKALGNKGIALNNSGKYADAINMYDQILKINQTDTWVLTEKGRSLNNLGNYNDAISLFDKVLKKDPNNANLLLLKSFSFSKLGLYKQAISNLDIILRNDPKNTQALLLKASSLILLGKTNEGMPYLDTVLSINPKDTSTMKIKAMILYGLGKYDEAITTYQKLLKIEPNNTDALYGIANSFFMTGNYETAITYYDGILKLDPNNTNAEYMKETAYKQTNKEIQGYTGTIRISFEGIKETDATYVKQLFQVLVDKVDKILYLPADISIVGKYCGKTTAYYDPNTKEIIMCYEFFKFLSSMNYPDQEKSKIIGSVIVFTFYHELGHALIDLYNLPTTGREEDTADQISILLIQSIDRGNSNNNEIIFNTARWFHDIGSSRTSQSQLAFWDEHSLDMQRFYDLVCMVYGSDPTTYSDLTQSGILPSERADKCVGEYQKISRSVGILLEPYMKQ